MKLPIGPAPLWRRLAAAVYDGLLLCGIWMFALLIDMIVRGLLGAPKVWLLLQLYLFLVGLGFFGWFWTHGGQTLGMRAWRIQVRRDDAAPLRWPVAAVRYAVLMLSWGVALAPAALQLPKLAAQHPNANRVAVACLLLMLVALFVHWRDARRRLPCDLASGTEVVVLAAPGAR